MDQRDIYQTLEDRSNNEFVENNGPFDCKRNDAWLGDGHYFWEYYIENAHWWGEKSYPNNYIICKASYVFNNKICFDLVDNYTNRELIKQISIKLENDNSYNGHITIPRIIAHLKDISLFNYKAVRIIGENVKSSSSKYSKSIAFQTKRPNSVYELIPPIQVCFYDKGIINLDMYSIVYPELYNTEYCI